MEELHVQNSDIAAIIEAGINRKKVAHNAVSMIVKENPRGLAFILLTPWSNFLFLQDVQFV